MKNYKKIIPDYEGTFVSERDSVLKYISIMRNKELPENSLLSQKFDILDNEWEEFMEFINHMNDNYNKWWNRKEK